MFSGDGEEKNPKVEVEVEVEVKVAVKVGISPNFMFGNILQKAILFYSKFTAELENMIPHLEWEKEM